MLPTLTLEDARAKALCVRREEWEKLQRDYGGGPLVPRLEICRECKVQKGRGLEERIQCILVSRRNC